AIEFGSGPYLVEDQFTAADIMMGFTLFAASTLNVLDDLPQLNEYLARITARPAFQRSLECLPL
ncbi:MAG: glutathione S-transferase family protein, partial [Pseudomonadota bacterium]